MVIALDTNMLVRAVVADHPAQLAVVRRLIANNTIFIPRTVLLETEWVLRARYGKKPAEITPFLHALLETDDTVVEAAEEVAQALDWYAMGADRRCDAPGRLRQGGAAHLRPRLLQGGARSRECARSKSLGNLIYWRAR